MANISPILIHSTNYSYGEYLKSLINQFGIQNTVLTGHSLTWNMFTRLNPKLAIFETGHTLSPILVKAIRHKSFPLIVISQEDIHTIRENNDLTYLGRPFCPGLFKKAVKRQLIKNNEGFPHNIPNGPFIIGNTKEIYEIRKIVANSNNDLTVLILGETGTGKGLMALAIHNNSNRKNNPFLEINCANISPSLFESELFGYKKGAFTGALEDKLGKFNIADSGTVFLDEISEMPRSMQARFLQVLQDGEFSPIGGVEDSKVNVKIIAATNANPMKLIEQRRLRKDFYYRLNVINIVIPPLRKRKDDIDLLREYFIEKYCLFYNKKPVNLSKRLCNIFINYDWPGNVRELENIIKNIVVLGDEHQVMDEFERKSIQNYVKDDLFGITRGMYDDIGRVSLKVLAGRAARKAEEKAIYEALNISGGNKKTAAGLLKVSYKSILNKIKEYSL
ncbi:MAG: sigma 54-interacting transcriptional regulator [Deltaproteobacteria bacterium]|nr:sigma 54-interacting transcriptional regulator [Deltaproteobacteria bacterium]MBW2661218.1 sigma 54-interacting transcriptional regulator [Deltaproteobacteria bacterium]